MSDNKPLLIYGAGGMAREVAWLTETCSSMADAVGFIDDFVNDQDFNGLPVSNLEVAIAKHPNCHISVGIADPYVRQSIVEKLHERAIPFTTLIHDSVTIHHSTKIGVGSIICAGCHITTNINIGKHVLINLACTVGHDVIIGDYTTISPGVNLSGNIKIGKNVFIGSGASLIQGTNQEPLLIADDSVIAAGACVIKPTEKGGLYAGVPAIRKK